MSSEEDTPTNNTTLSSLFYQTQKRFVFSRGLTPNPPKIPWSSRIDLTPIIVQAGLGPSSFSTRLSGGPYRRPRSDVPRSLSSSSQFEGTPKGTVPTLQDKTPGRGPSPRRRTPTLRRVTRPHPVPDHIDFQDGTETFSG